MPTAPTPLSPAPPRPRGRPATPPDAAEARQRLIRAGLIFLTERGYGATALEDILHSAAITKGAFYHYFDSKADFADTLISAYHDHFARRLDRRLLDPGLAPLDRLRAFTEDAESGMARHGFRRGCLIGNLGQEMGALPEPFRARLTDVLADWQARTAACLTLARDTGTLAPRHDPALLAEFFWTGWEGAVLRAKLDASPAPLRRFRQQFFALLTQ